MAGIHRIPDDINPSGDYCVPLFIPLDPQYTALLLGALKTLEEVEYYNLDEDFGDDEARQVAGIWRDRTLTPLTEAIATALACGGHMNAQLLSGAQANYTTTATTYTATGFSVSYTPTKPNALIKVYMPISNNSGAITSNHQVRFDGNAGNTDKPSTVTVGVVQNIVAAGIFTGLTVGVAKNITVYGKVSAGSTQIHHGTTTNSLVEVIEYD